MASLIYVTALERTRDFAVLKALGASSSNLFVGLALQAVVVALIAAVAAAVVAQFMTGVFSQPIDFPTSAYVALPLSAVLVGHPGEPGRAPTGRGRRPGQGVRGVAGAMSELEVHDLTVEFDSGGYRVRPLDSLDIEARDGELVVLLGPSGCGKTTLLSCLSGLLRPTEGSIRFQGIEVETLSGAARRPTARRR